MSAIEVDSTARAALSADLVDRVGGHDLRLSILAVIGDRAATAAEVARMLEVSVSTVRYQLRTMAKLGLVKRAGETSRRGVVEHSYTVARDFADDDDFESLTADRKLKVVSSVMKMIFGDALRSLKAGIFNRRPDRCVARVPVQVDEQGWAELARIHDEAVGEVIRVREQSARRLAESGEESISAMSALLFIERP